MIGKIIHIFHHYYSSNKRHWLIYVALPILYLISRIYLLSVIIRRNLYKKGVLKGRILKSFVISIGNISVGGTGKTPVTIYLAKTLKRAGYTVSIVAKGYKGTYTGKTAIVSDGENILISSEEAGDEAFMLANKLNKTGIPIVIGRQKSKSALFAEYKFMSQIIIIDDGFQHLQLKRDLDIVLFSPITQKNGGEIFPLGGLREPLDSLRRSNIIIVKKNANSIASTVAKIIEDPHIFALKSQFIFKEINNIKSGKEYPLSFIKGKNILVFCAIGDPEYFKKNLKGLGCTVKEFICFPDHYGYTKTDIDLLKAQADSSLSEIIITTEKDAVKLHHELLNDRFYKITINIDFFGNEEKLLSFIEKEYQRKYN